MMKGRKKEDNEVKSHEQGIFAHAGPVHLTSVDWEIPHHRSSVAASLVQGVYTLERDRQNKRSGSEALAPSWWQFFHFQCIQILADPKDSSTFGAIFEYKPLNFANFHPMTSQDNIPPRYVIAFRGTLIEPNTRKQDVYLNMHVALNGLTRTSRYQIAVGAIKSITTRTGPTNVWLAGHSLGASIALQAGKDMAKMGCYIKSYLFNPPFPSPPIEKFNDTSVKNKIRFTGSLITAGLSLAIQGKKGSTHEYDGFSSLCSWIPYLFVNPMDVICCEYIGYFENRERMEEMGASGIERIASKNAILSLLSGNGEAPHLIPSAMLIKNMVGVPQDHKQAHGVEQWWNPQPYWQYMLYQFK